MFPPSNPDPGLLAAIRTALSAADYTTRAVGARTGASRAHATEGERKDAPADALDALIALFLDARTLPREDVARLLSIQLLEGLERLEALAAVPGDTARVQALVALYPAQNLYVVSDLDTHESAGRTDSVFPVSEPDIVYLSSFPRTPCGRFLELCSGTGIGALVAAASAERAWAVDITERSTRFARFNAALNGLTNVVALQGDLYAPVEGLQFDRIVAHPPYVPAVEQRQIYRDGGADGEQVTRGVLAGARAHLAPGGRLYCTCVATEREGRALEQRCREMVGPDSDDCDVVVFVSPSAILFPFEREVAAGRMQLDEFQRVLETFGRLRITQFVACTIVVERHGRPRAPITLRRARGDGDLAASLDAVVQWEAFAATEQDPTRIMDVRPLLAPGARLEATHVARDGRWQFVGTHVAVRSPVPIDIDTSPAAATFLALCDGTRTVREMLDHLVAEGTAPADAPPDALASLVLSLLREGVLQGDLPAVTA